MNQGVDALSRVMEFQCLVISIPQSDWWAILQPEAKTDPFYLKISQLPNPQSYLLRDGILFKNIKSI